MLKFHMYLYLDTSVYEYSVPFTTVVPKHILHEIQCGNCNILTSSLMALLSKQ